jgi:hypothetical protein
MDVGKEEEAWCGQSPILVLSQLVHITRGLKTGPFTETFQS